MAGSVQLRPATAADALALAPVAREADRQEVLALCGRSVLEALQDGLSAPGGLAYTGERDGKLLAMFGLVPLSINSSIHGIWMIGSDEMSVRPWEWLRAARAVIAYWRTLGRLVNVVHVRHLESIRFLGWLGATFKPPIQMGPEGEWFLPFEI